LNQVAPNQAPIAGAMQPNVQSPQVAAAQTSIVQSQQTPTLPTNEQTETQTPSQESFPVSTSLICCFIYIGKVYMLLGRLLFGDGHYYGVLDKILV